MIPDSYQPAEWRNTTSADADNQQIGVGFNLLDGSIMRLALSLDGAKDLAETLIQSLSIVHSPSSSGSPSVDVSMSFDGENV